MPVARSLVRNGTVKNCLQQLYVGPISPVKGGRCNEESVNRAILLPTALSRGPSVDAVWIRSQGLVESWLPGRPKSTAVGSHPARRAFDRTTADAVEVDAAGLSLASGPGKPPRSPKRKSGNFALHHCYPPALPRTSKRMCSRWSLEPSSRLCPSNNQFEAAS